MDWMCRTWHTILNAMHTWITSRLLVFGLGFVFLPLAEHGGFARVVVILLLTISVQVDSILPNSCIMLFSMQEIEAEMARTQK